MKFSAIQRLTLLDYPGHTACTLFTPGCNFRCHYCHNSEFVLPEKLKKIEKDFIPEESIFAFLQKRKGLLEGVCITGGEPTIHRGLPEFIKKVRKLGYNIKLDTNGSNPKMLHQLIDEKLVDYVAMDVKSGNREELIINNDSKQFCGVSVDESALRKSRDLLMNSGIEYEFRTTLVKEFHDDYEFINILQCISGAKRYYLQNFRSRGGCLDKKWEQYSGFSEKELHKRMITAKKYVENCEVRI